MCGLFGHIGQRPAEPTVIKLLWIYSSLRGTDSTGLYRNSLISKRWYQWQKSSGDSFDVAFGVLLRKTIDNHTIIGHCRAKSVGEVSESNTHPFEYNVNGNRWIFAHNGTVKNIEELATRYNIDRRYGETDSQTLGHILAEGNWNVLNEYKGSAAFSLYNETEDVLYLWRGFSMHDSLVPSDERPLFVYIGKNYMYWASDPMNLATGLNTRKNIIPIPENTLVIVRNGRIDEQIVYNRTNVDSYTTTYVRPANEEPYVKPSKKNKSFKLNNQYKQTLLDEPNPQNMARSKIYFWKGKYYRNGHLANGWACLRDDGTYLGNFNTNETGSSMYYFYKGYMLKSLEKYEQLTGEKPEKFDLNVIEKAVYDFSENWLHPETILPVRRGTTEWFAMDGKYLFNCSIRPKFGYYVYNLDKQGNVVSFRNVNIPDNHPLVTDKIEKSEESSLAVEGQWANYF